MATAHPASTRDPFDWIDPDRLTFDLQRVAASVGIPTGLQHPTFDVRDYAAGHLVATLTAYVMTEPAGPPAAGHLSVALPLKPWWLPRFVWRRWPTKVARYTVTARPLWSYPSSSVKVPALGEPVRLLAHPEVSW